MRSTFPDRHDAGRRLAAAVASLHLASPVALALPRGGVPVAYEIARALGAPLDVLVVRKLGVPWHEELAMGAVASGGLQVLNDDVIREHHVPPAAVEAVAARELLELRRRETTYRLGRPATELAGRSVVLVDDGIATGASMEVAILAARRAQARQVVVAAPVAARDTVDRLRRLADDCVVLLMPDPLYGVALWYDDFTQTSDAEVRELLSRADAARRTPGEAHDQAGVR